MSSAPAIEPFKGRGTWEECDNFIRAIRAAALKEDKLWDNGWMANLASLHFSQEALLWHSQLPDDVRRDWSRLETSILARWAPSQADARTKIEPTSEVASDSPKRSDMSDHSIQGVLKLVVEGYGWNEVFYVQFRDGSTTCSVTSDIKDALRVRYSPASKGSLLEKIDESSFTWLAVHWSSQTPNIGDGSTDYAYLTLVDSDTLTSTWTNSHPRQLIRCTVSGNGEVRPVWKKDKTNETVLFPFIYLHSPFLVADPVTYSKTLPAEKRAKLFIEPIEQA